MRIPFEKLMEAVSVLTEDQMQMSLAAVAQLLGEPDPWRVADAITAVRVVRGQRTYIEMRADEEPAVRKALAEDRGTVVSGSVNPWVPGL